MLKHLRMGFALVALHGAALAASRVLAAPLWGPPHRSPRRRPVLVACAFGVSALPVIWLFPTPTFLWPLVLDAVMAGRAVGRPQPRDVRPAAHRDAARGRPFYIAAIAAAAGVTFSLATLCGGALAQRCPSRRRSSATRLHSLQLLFALSAVLRFGAAFAALGIHEPSAAGLGALFTAVVRRPRGRGDRPPGSSRVRKSAPCRWRLLMVLAFVACSSGESVPQTGAAGAGGGAAGGRRGRQ
jgi:hypothetical protein